jgi:hypothetical protein
MVAGNAIGMPAESVQIIPDHLCRFKYVQRDMMKMIIFFTGRGETQIDLSTGIATAENEEMAWPP